MRDKKYVRDVVNNKTPFQKRRAGWLMSHEKIVRDHVVYSLLSTRHSSPALFHIPQRAQLIHDALIDRRCTVIGVLTAYQRLDLCPERFDLYLIGGVRR